MLSTSLRLTIAAPIARSGLVHRPLTASREYDFEVGLSIRNRHSDAKQILLWEEVQSPSAFPPAA